VTVAEEVTTAELARNISRLDSEMSRALARIEGKLDRVTDDHELRLRSLERVDVQRIVAEYEERIEKVETDYETRLRSLEKWMWGLSGGSLGTAIISAAIQLFGDK
jgi:hypothetical protein